MLTFRHNHIEYKNISANKWKFSGESPLDQLLFFRYESDEPWRERMHHALGLGNEFSGTEFGIISHIENNDYEVLFCDAPKDSIQVGAHYKLGDTYCCHTMLAMGPVGFHHAGRSHIYSHPCYRRAKLETYIGCPYSINGVIAGTVNFSSPEPREQPFTMHEECFILSLAEWIGTRLSLEN